MEGTLVVNEERQNVNKFKKWYQEKMIDTNMSKKSEKMIKGVSKFAGEFEKGYLTIAGIVCKFIPGAEVLAPICPVAGKIKSKIYEFGGDAAINAKRFIEGKIIGVDGTSKDVSVPKFDSQHVSDNVKGIASDVKDLMSEAKELESVGKTL